jgi:hypothetical protein
LSKRKKRSRQQPQHPSKVFLTLSAARMLKDALRTFETALLQNTKPLPNLGLAAETVGVLKIKLGEMLQGEDWERETPFDYNEVHILHTAVRMHLVDLEFSPQKNMLSAYILLCKQFSRMIKCAEAKHIEIPKDQGK